MDARTLAWLDREDQRTARMVREHGWGSSTSSASASSRPFAYTIGLLRLGHPELIVFGLDAGSAGRLIT